MSGHISTICACPSQTDVCLDKCTRYRYKQNDPHLKNIPYNMQQVKRLGSLLDALWTAKDRQADPSLSLAVVS